MRDPDPDPATLVVFCRRPAPGVGKQRIAARLGQPAAVALGERLLKATVEDAGDWPGPVVLAVADPTDAAWAATLLPGRAAVLAQGAGNLGARLSRVDRALRVRGQETLAFIGTDAPMLDGAYFAAARAALRSAEVVLGPAEDGGVTLMGSRCAWPGLDDLPWSGDSLGARLAARCREQGQRVSLLPLRYDIDEAECLPRLLRDLASDPRPARRALREWLTTALPHLTPGRAETGRAG